MNDEILWGKLRSGDKVALKQIYDTHIDALLQYGHRFCKDEQKVHDCIHDLFVYLWEKKETLSATDSIIRYLLVAIRRRIIKAIHVNTVEWKETDTSFLADISIEDKVIKDEELEEEKAQITAAMVTLSNRQKEAIYLKYYKGLKYDEICQIMDISNQSVRNLVASGLKVMRKVLSQWLFTFFMFNEYISAFFPLLI